MNNIDHRHDFQEETSHTWLKHAAICYVPGPAPTPLLDEVVAGILDAFRRRGHDIQQNPSNSTDILLTSAPYGEPLTWRKSILLTGRRRFKLDQSPTVFSLIHIRRDQLEAVLAHFERALAKEPLDPGDYAFPGLAPAAHHVLHEQGRRGGPILALERLLQAQSKCINLLLLVGDMQPEGVYHFDLVGGFPYSDGSQPDGFYQDIALRMLTKVSTHEITDHQMVGEALPLAAWQALETPSAMCAAARELDRRGFFTEMVRISDLVHVPSVSESVSSQYSEGCFATWDADLGALIATITGSARPVNKGEISADDLTVITGVRPDSQGALVRYVQDKANYPPSSEAVEMYGMDLSLPRVSHPSGNQVPVVRSKLHGHRGIAAYNPELVEFVPLDMPYYHYPVTCATEAQATAIRNAFARSQALNHPADPRQVIFTILPTHGVVIVEKWVAGKAPIQIIWEHFDAGHLVLDKRVPQNLVIYRSSAGKMALV